MNPEINLRWPAITCVHVAFMNAPVFFVALHEPACEDDSGWTFTCGQDGHLTEELLVVGIGTVLKYDPSVEELLLLPMGYCASRNSLDEPWVIEPL